MTETRFKSEMLRADTFLKLEPARAEYWSGYIRGLRRQYHGKAFGTADEHAQWLEAASSDDPARRDRGVGYRAGLEAT